MKTITLRVSDELHARLKQMAADLGKPMSRIIGSVMWWETEAYAKRERFAEYCAKREQPLTPKQHKDGIRAERRLERNMDRRKRPADPAGAALEECERFPETLTLPKELVRKDLKPAPRIR